MSTKGSGFLVAAGVLGAMLVCAAPALAQSHGSGGGHSGGGQASGGGRVGGGGGGSRPSGAGHFGGGGPSSGGGHFAGNPRYAPGGHFAGAGTGGGVRGYGGSAYTRSYPSGYRGGYYRGGYPGRGAFGRTGYYGHPSYYGRGYSTGVYWRGGYWHGGFWPRCYYGYGFSWFLPILPLAYATYWYSGIPYYYAHDVYYTYSPSYAGYVATDPPPVAESSTAADGAASSAGPAPGDGAAMAGQIIMYPKNAQSAEQQATDKAECQQWAEQQAGPVAQNGSDYRRAMTACVEGRGYSAR